MPVIFGTAEVLENHIPSRRSTVVRDTPVLRMVANEMVCFGRAHHVRPMRRASETIRHVRDMMTTACRERQPVRSSQHLQDPTYTWKKRRSECVSDKEEKNELQL